MSRQECPNVEVNLVDCPCDHISQETQQPCSRKGICCECVINHKAHDSLPACFREDFVKKGLESSK